MKSELLAVVGPVTTTLRLQKMLNKMGDINARSVHTPASLSTGGCSYSIRTLGKSLSMIVELAKKNNIKVKAYYLVNSEDGKEVYHALP